MTAGLARRCPARRAEAAGALANRERVREVHKRVEQQERGGVLGSLLSSLCCGIAESPIEPASGLEAMSPIPVPGLGRGRLTRNVSGGRCAGSLPGTGKRFKVLDGVANGSAEFAVARTVARDPPAFERARGETQVLRSLGRREICMITHFQDHIRSSPTFLLLHCLVDELLGLLLRTRVELDAAIAATPLLAACGALVPELFAIRDAVRPGDSERAECEELAIERPVRLRCSREKREGRRDDDHAGYALHRVLLLIGSAIRVIGRLPGTEESNEGGGPGRRRPRGAYRRVRR